MGSTLITHECVKAEDVLRALTNQPSTGLFYEVEEVAFRGQADAEWDLVPCALRPRALRPYDKREGHSITMREKAMLKRFVDLCEANALDTAAGFEALSGASDRSDIADVLQNAESGDGSKWPPSQLHGALALAQHNGMPTRLLDWTRNPLVAAYFAAREAAESFHHRGATDKRLAIWTLKPWHFHIDAAADHWPNAAEVVRVPRSLNPNLHAQAGLFTLVRGIDPPPLNRLIEEHARRPTRTLWRLTLPWSESADLLTRLAVLGVSGASVFPGYGGAVAALRERLFWQV